MHIRIYIHIYIYIYISLSHICIEEKKRIYRNDLSNLCVRARERESERQCAYWWVGGLVRAVVCEREFVCVCV